MENLNAVKTALSAVYDSEYYRKYFMPEKRMDVNTKSKNKRRAKNKAARKSRKRNRNL